MPFKYVSSVGIIGIVLISLLSSCQPYHKISYMPNLKPIDTLAYKNVRVEKTINPYDELYIHIISTDEKSNLLFNNDRNGGNSSRDNIYSYIVDAGGSINFPFIGTINLAGQTVPEASAKIQKELSSYINNVSVRARLINNTVTILGDVRSEGAFSFTRDKISIFDALALAGGITAMGDRSKVLLMRKRGNETYKEFLNLQDVKILTSKYYYIESQDVIIVYPLKAKRFTYQNNTLSYLSTLVSTTVAVVALLISLKK